MDILIIIIASAAASLITLFSGFGLGTILTPVFVFFFPVEAAIALTGIVHLFNNVFKLGLLGKQARWNIVLRFGLPSIVGAYCGAALLLSLTHIEPLYQYQWGEKVFSVKPLNLIIAVLMIYFAAVEMIPQWQTLKPPMKSLPAGGFISGFFGGLSGHQGALRSMFLVRYELPKEQFLATGIVVACFVDGTRLSLYSSQFFAADLVRHADVILIAITSAFLGAYLGSRLLPKVTNGFVQKLVAVFLVIVALGLGIGAV